jgi:hypothetical protein
MVPEKLLWVPQIAFEKLLMVTPSISQKISKYGV